MDGVTEAQSSPVTCSRQRSWALVSSQRRPLAARGAANSAVLLSWRATPPTLRSLEPGAGAAVPEAAEAALPLSQV